MAEVAPVHRKEAHDRASEGGLSMSASPGPKPVDDDLRSEVQALRRQVERLTAIVSPPISAADAELLRALAQTFDRDPFTAGEVISRAKSSEALVIALGSTASGATIGKRLSRIARADSGELRLVRTRNKEHGNRMWVIECNRV